MITSTEKLGQITGLEKFVMRAETQAGPTQIFCHTLIKSGNICHEAILFPELSDDEISRWGRKIYSGYGVLLEKRWIGQITLHKAKNFNSPRLHFTDLLVKNFDDHPQRRQGHGTLLVTFADYLAQAFEKEMLTAEIEHVWQTGEIWQSAREREAVASKFYRDLGFEIGVGRYINRKPISLPVKSARLTLKCHEKGIKNLGFCEKSTEIYKECFTRGY